MVIVVVIAVLAVAFAGLIPGVHLPGGRGASGSGPSGPVPFSVARVAASHAANTTGAGPWGVALAIGANSVAPVTVPVANLTGAVSGGGCTFTPASGSGTTAVRAAPGGVGNGDSSFWAFLMRNASGGISLVLVLNGSGVPYGTLGGSGCASGLGLFAPVTGAVIDSTAAVAAADQAGGTAFLASHPDANGSMVITGGISEGLFTTPPFWIVAYSDCSIQAQSGVSAGTFEAVVDASNGVVQTANTSIVGCSSVLGGGPGPGGGSTPLGTLFALGASSPGNCTSGGASDPCSYTFPIESSSSSVLPELLTFTLQNSSGFVEDGLVTNITLVDITGCAVGVFTFPVASSGVWTGHACGSGSGLATPVLTSETIVLHTDAALGGQGYRLVVSATSGSPLSGSLYALVT